MCLCVFVFVWVYCVIKETQLINKERWCVHSQWGVREGGSGGWNCESYVALLDRLFVCVCQSVQKVDGQRERNMKENMLSGRCVK